MIVNAQAGRLYMVTAPTYGMLRDATYRTFREIATQLGVWVDIHKTDFTAIIRAKGGPVEVLFRSADDPDKLRGPNLSHLWMDEASLQAHEAYQISVARLREGGRHGRLTATFTPKGMGHWTYDVFGTNRPDVFTAFAETRDNPFVAPEFLDTVYSAYAGLRAEQELGGRFVSVEGAEWPAEFFPPSIWFDDWPRDLTIKTIGLDPSKGKDAKHGDYSAIVLLGRTPDGTLWCEADLQRRVSTQIVEDLLEWQRVFVADGIAIETNQFQELLKDDVERVSSERGIMAPCWGLDNRVNKEVRIRRLTPYLSKRKMRFKANSPGTAMLVQQLRDFPEGEFDDGPDSAELALRLAVHLWNGAGQEAQETVFA